MTKIKFIHSADLHLDTPFRGLLSINSELADRLKDATFKSFEKIIDLCINEQADFLIVSGDIFDSEVRSLAAQLKFVKGLQKLSDKGIYTYFICGNHDPLNSWMENLALPEKVIRFGSSKVENALYTKNGNPLARIYGISYRTNSENRDLASKFTSKDEPVPFSIALLHGTIGSPGPHAGYAPFRLDDIAHKGFDYWALGHIHKKQIIHTANPAVVYPGNPQGRDFGETGARGCFIVEMTQGSDPAIRFRPTDSIRFEKITVDLTGADKINHLEKYIAKAVKDTIRGNDSVSYILRIALKGRTPLHTLLNNDSELKTLLDELNDAQPDRDQFTRIDSISVETQPDIDMDKLRKGNDFTAELLKMIEETKDPLSLFRAIEDENKIPAVARKIIAEYPTDETALMEKVKWLLLEQLT